MEAKDYAAIGSVVVALCAFSWQFWRATNEVRKREKRNANKLEIFHLCRERGQSEEQVRDVFANKGRRDRVDAHEVKLSIYEMLAEGTLVYIGDATTYEATSCLSRETAASAPAPAQSRA